VRGSGIGASFCPPLYLGACLQLENGAQLIAGTANANGRWQWNVTAPTFLTPGDVFAFQAVAVGASGAASAPVVRVIQDDAELACDDQIDNDFDGLADCADDDCANDLACIPVACDAGSCCFTDTTVVAFGELLTGDLDGSDPTNGPGGVGRAFDDIEFVGAQGQELFVDLEADIPVYVELRNEDCVVLGGAPVGSGELKLPFRLPADGVYTMVVSARDAGDTGAYQLRLSEVRDSICDGMLGSCCFGDTLTLNVPGEYNGSLDTFDAIGGPQGGFAVYDDVEFEAVQGQNLTVTLETDFTSGAVHLLDDTCAPVASAPVGGGQAQIRYTAPYDGIYTATASRVGGSQFGYTLTVADDSPIPTCTDDIYESNDVQSAATPLPGDGITFEATSCDGDVDWYSFTAFAGQYIDTNVAQEFSQQGSMDVFVYAPDGSLFGDSTGSTTFHSIDDFAAQSGTYLVEVVFERAPFREGLDYDIWVDARDLQPCTDDALESNDTIASATQLTPGPGSVDAQSCDGDDDYYRVDVLGGELTTFSVADSSGIVDFEVLDFNGNVLAEGDFTGVATYTAPVDDRVWVRVFFVSDDTFVGGGVDYTLTYGASQDCVEDVYEPNESFLDAAPLGAGTYTALSVCDSVDNDFYAIDLVAGDLLTIDVLFSDAEADIDARLYDEDGTTILQSGSSTSDNETLTYFESLSPTKTVYLEVFLWSDGSPLQPGGNYDLVIDIN
jgi:hypothetical protein